MSENAEELDTEEEEIDEQTAHSVRPVVWVGILVCFAVLAIALSAMYEASVGLRNARLYQEVKQLIASAEQLDSLLRTPRYSDLLDPSSSRTQNTVAVLRLTYEKKYERALRKTRIKSFSKLEVSGDLTEVLEELVAVSEELKQSPEEAPPAKPPEKQPEDESNSDPEKQLEEESAAPEQETPTITEEAQVAEQRKKLEEEYNSLQEEALQLAKEAVLELSEPKLTQNQIDSYQWLSGFLKQSGYVLPELP